MWKQRQSSFLARRLTGLWLRAVNQSYTSLVDTPSPIPNAPPRVLEKSIGGREEYADRSQNDAIARGFQIGKTVSKRDKINFIVDTLLDLKNSKEAVYGALDSWVAWEEDFPIVSLRKALVTLEKEQQWHRIVQVIKWMLSKGQGNTMGTYGQLIRALDKDHRAEEAHNFWTKKIGSDLHSVPWQLCHLMISVYYRNNMPERVIELFKGLEAFNRKPPQKEIVQRVADACEITGMLDEKARILKKYNHLLNGSEKESSKKSVKRTEKHTTASPDTLS